MSGVRVYYDWFAGTLSNLLAAGIMDDVDPGLTIGWKDGKQITEKKEETPWWEPTGRSNGGKGKDITKVYCIPISNPFQNIPCGAQ